MTYVHLVDTRTLAIEEFIGGDLEAGKEWRREYLVGTNFEGNIERPELGVERRYLSTVFASVSTSQSSEWDGNERGSQTTLAPNRSANSGSGRFGLVGIAALALSGGDCQVGREIDYR